ncbi:MAG: OB-fold nucleic acid binding domain-containing protein [archaeon]
MADAFGSAPPVEGGQTEGGEGLLKRRNPAIPRKISEISGADRRVRLSGKIEKKGLNGALTLSDGTGRAEVFFDNLDVVDEIEKNYREGEQVLVSGLVVPQGPSKFDINGEIILKSAAERGLSGELIKRAEGILAKHG